MTPPNPRKKTFYANSSLALFIGLVVGNVLHPGSGFNINAATLDAKAVADYAGQAKAQSISDFLMRIIPTTVVDAFAKGDILQVLLVAMLFGFALSMVGPTGFTFNTDGTSIYMTLSALFVAQATNTPLTLTQQLTILAVAVLTSKGASGVQGASFIALVATMTVIPTIPVAGMALILGIDRFMSMCRATVNMIGNGVATLVVSRWEKELSAETLRNNLAWRKSRAHGPAP